ncbi:MAG: DUF3413 domain-containing protein [Desulfobacterales bacterium]|nr:DUF3413 domain-containing protein [Desulfobacterales bacterium]
MIQKNNPSPRRSLLRWGAWFTFFNTLLALLISLRYLGQIPTPNTPMAWGYMLTMPPSQMALLTFIPYLLIFIPLALLFPARRFMTIFWVVLSTVGLSILVCDTSVYAQFRFHISYIYVDMILKTGNQIIGFPPQVWAMIAGAILALLLAESILAHVTWKFITRRTQGKLGKKLAAVITLFYILSNGTHIWADAHYDNSVTVLTQSYPLLYPATAKSFMLQRGWIDVEAYRQESLLNQSTSSSSGILNYPLSSLTCETRSPQSHLNVLVIALDSWRSDSMTPEITPIINDFSRNALEFKEHYSGGNATRTGIFSLFYGLPATYWKAFEVSQKGPVLMQQFIKHGYATGIFGSAPLNSPEFDRTVFSDVKEFPISTPGKNSADRDEEITRRWLKFMETWSGVPKEDKKPFFGFLFYDSLHAYHIPQGSPMPFQPSWNSVNHLLLNNDTDPTPFKNFYHNICLFQDRLVGEVLEDLKKRHLLNQTIVVITGDHGEEFNDNKKNFWGHNGNFTAAQTRVPFILHWPGIPPESISARSSHMDLAPTLMKNLFHCTNPLSDYSVGQDLLEPGRKPLDHLIMSSYSKFALYDFKEGRITVQQPAGFYQLFDEELNERPRKEINAPAFLEAMKKISRFYE